eukprot:SAG22_NODE_152_length_17377_cov_191.856928_23_plen_197_part_00
MRADCRQQHMFLPAAHYARHCCPCIPLPLRLCMSSATPASSLLPTTPGTVLPCLPLRVLWHCPSVSSSSSASPLPLPPPFLVVGGSVSRSLTEPNVSCAVVCWLVPAGVAVEVTGLLRCMLSPGGTPRIVLLARPSAAGAATFGPSRLFVAAFPCVRCVSLPFLAVVRTVRSTVCSVLTKHRPTACCLLACCRRRQ